MYNELIQSLRCCADDPCDNCKFRGKYMDSCDRTLKNEAADAIEELLPFKKQVEKGMGLLDKADKLLNAIKPRWIPVTERLPEIDEKNRCSKDVLAYLKDGEMCFTALEENIFGQAWFDCERNPDVEEEMIVTHWMPLPQPPKEET